MHAPDPGRSRCAAPLSWRRSRRSTTPVSRRAGALDRSLDRRQSGALSDSARCRPMSSRACPTSTRSKSSKRLPRTAMARRRAPTLSQRPARRRSFSSCRGSSRRNASAFSASLMANMPKSGARQGSCRRSCRISTLCARCDVAIDRQSQQSGRQTRAGGGPIAALASHLARKGGLLVVDEAFVDLLPARASLVPILPEAGALVLRSFGKTYGLPGLRLGFAVDEQASRRKAAALCSDLGPCPVRPSPSARQRSKTRPGSTHCAHAWRGGAMGSKRFCDNAAPSKSAAHRSFSSSRIRDAATPLRGFRPRGRAAAAFSRAAELAARRPRR